MLAKISEKWPGQHSYWGLIIVFLLAFSLRIYGLNAVALDEDETYEYHRWVSHSFSAIVVDDVVLNNPVFSLILSRTSILWLGNQLFSLRWPAVFISVLGVAAIYKIGQRLFDPGVALAAAFLMAISPYAVAFAHTFRGYSSVVSFTLIIYLFGLLALQTGQWRYWIGLGLTGVVSLYSHLFVIFAIINLFLFIGWVGQKNFQGYGFKKLSYRQPALALLLLVGLVAIIYMPVLNKILQSLAETGDIASGKVLWVQRPQVSASIWTNLLWFNGLEKGHYGQYGLYPFLGLVMLGLWLGYAKGQGVKLLVLISWALLPFFEVWLLGQILPNFWTRPQYLGYTLPPLLILAAIAVTYWSAYRPPRKWLLAGVVFSLLAGLILFWYLTLGEYFSVLANGNWQAVSNFLQRHSQPSDLVVCQQYVHPWRDQLIDAEDACTRTLNYRRKAGTPMVSDVQISHQLVYGILPQARGGAINRSGRVWLVAWDIPASVNLNSLKTEGLTLTEFNGFGRSAVLQLDSPQTYAENLLQGLLALRSVAQTNQQHYLYSLMIAPLAAVSGQNNLAQQSLAEAADYQPDHPESAAKRAVTAQLVKSLTPLVAQNPMEANFGDEIRLRGYNLSADTVRPASSVKLTLFWEALKPIPHDYTVFLHVRNQAGQTITQFDYPPFDGSYSTRQWQPGQSLAEERDLPIPADFPPGEYKLMIGLYNQQTQERLPLVNVSSGENALLITSVRVQ